MKDLFHDIEIKKVIAPISPAATGTISGTVIDRQNAGNVTFIISNGAATTTNISVTPVVKEGSTTGTLTSVANADLIGTESGATFSGTGDAGKCAKIGYIGNERYVTVDLVVANAATGVHSVAAVLGAKRKKPADTQKQA